MPLTCTKFNWIIEQKNDANIYWNLNRLQNQTLAPLLPYVANLSSVFVPISCAFASGGTSAHSFLSKNDANHMLTSEQLVESSAIALAFHPIFIICWICKNLFAKGKRIFAEIFESASFCWCDTCEQEAFFFKEYVLALVSVQSNEIKYLQFWYDKQYWILHVYLIVGFTFSMDHW